MKTKILELIALLILCCTQLSAETFSVKSPDGKLEASVSDGDKLTLKISADKNLVFDSFPVAMKTDKGNFGINSKVKKTSLSSVNESIKTAYGIRSVIKDNYNQLDLDFGTFKLLVRAYNESIAYRFVYNKAGEIVVFDETLDLPLSSDDKIIGHPVKSFLDAYESFFLRETVADMKKHHSYELPLLAKKNGYTVAVLESDVLDYPALRFTTGAKSIFAKTPKTFSQHRVYLRKVDSTHDYIAKTQGIRAFPWRAFVVARKDSDLADNDTVYKLASPTKILDTSWIKYGTCAWEWYSNCHLEGVDFVTGVNIETYMYFVDFAANNNIPYVLIDAGWLTGFDIDKMDDKVDEAAISGKSFIDVKKIIEYAHSKNVKILLWCLGQSLDKYGERAFDIMKSWGADGVKIDFVERDDQQAAQFYERMAKIAADRQMVIDFHGCAKPAGLQRTYPNVINFEAVRGGETNKFVDKLEPSHNVDLVFTRMLQGPMDYTPGALQNRQKEDFRRSFSFPQAKGTRANMVAMYILYYAPLQMLCDSPTEYLKYPDILNFIANAPTSWDDTKALDGKIGEYVVLARRKGDIWYVGAMSDWNEREVEIDLSKILPKDTDFKAEIIKDSINSNRMASDYTREIKAVTSDEKLKIKLSKGGGVAIKLTPRIPVIDDIVDFFTE